MTPTDKKCCEKCGVNDLGNANGCWNKSCPCHTLASTESWEEEFMREVTEAIKSDHNDLRKERIILRATRQLITQIREEVRRCGKSIEEDGICGVRLDCHLHDWRSDLDRERGFVEGRVSLKEEVVRLCEDFKGWGACLKHGDIAHETCIDCVARQTANNTLGLVINKLGQI